MTGQPQSLRSLFAAAKAAKTSLESRTDSTTDAYRADVNATIAQFEECQRNIQSLSLFSSNEALEDVATGDLQYLTLEYLLAELIQRSYSSNREALLRRATELYEQYLTHLDEYGLLSPADKKLYERYVESPSAFTLAPLNDAAVRREVKVARFKEEKELKERLEYLSRNRNRLNDDDDDIRKLYLAEINLYTHQTFQSLDLLAQEVAMLSAMRTASISKPGINPMDDSRRRKEEENSQDSYSERLDPPLAQLLRGGRLGPLLTKEGKPRQPFTLLDRRTQLQQGVFKPGHNLPTMTIDEYLEEERRRGGIIEGGGEQSGMKPEVDEDDLERADAETMKAREWDEFKEANPRGSGNTLNRG